MEHFLKQCYKDELKRVGTNDATISALVQLLEAVQKNDLDLCKSIVAQNGITRDHIACHQYHHLGIACELGHYDIVRWMVEEFNISEEDIRQSAQYVVHRAIANGHLKVVQYMIERFEHAFDHLLGGRYLRMAVSGGHFHVIAWILDKYNVEPSGFMEGFDSDENELKIKAAMKALQDNNSMTKYAGKK